MSAFLRGQILYRAAEMLEMRRVELESELARVKQRREQARAVGRAGLFVDAGRTRAGDAIVFAVGFSQIKKSGSR